MHELSIASAIVATVERHAGGSPVTSVRVRVGRLRQVVPDSLEFCFGMVARESVCEGARLEIMTMSAHLAASLAVMHLTPARSAWARLALPSLRATTTSVTPLSFMLLAWPKPWLP
jgi:hydrogenase nickel incorporation protein HypA/HybF